MIYLFHGSDRKAALSAAQKTLGSDYETVDAADLTSDQLTDIFYGQSLFDAHRRILVKDLCAIRPLRDRLPSLLDTVHEIVLLEDRIDLRVKLFQELSKNPHIKIKKFEKPENTADRFFSFEVFEEAFSNGRRAALRLHKRRDTEDAILIIGAWSSRAVDNYKKHPTPKNKRVLKELAKIDLKIKSSAFAANPWPLLELFLINLQNF